MVFMLMCVGVFIYIVSGSYKFVYGDFSTLYQFPCSVILTVCFPLAGKDDAQGEHGKTQSRAGLGGSHYIARLGHLSIVHPTILAEFSISNTERRDHG